MLFIDEIHRLSPVVEEIHPALEDYRIDIMIGEGGARSVKLDLQPFTLVGATTRAGMLTNRCATASASSPGSSSHAEELARIVARSAGLLDLPADEAGAFEIARRSRGTRASPIGCCAACATMPT